MAEQNMKMRKVGGRRAPPKAQAKQNVAMMGAMAKGRQKGPVTKQPKGMLVEEEEERGRGKAGKGKGKAGAKDKVYNVKAEYDGRDGDPDSVQTVVMDEFPVEEWSGMHVREGR